MFTESIIDQFIVKVRLQAVMEEIDEKAALSYAAAKLRLETGEFTKYDYYRLIDETNQIFSITPESEADKSLELNRWIEQQLNKLKMTQLS